MSAAEVARELDLTHANASYHLRVLLEAGELVDAGEEKIRGGVAKRYRYPHEQRGVPRQPEHPSADDRVSYARAVGHELERRVGLFGGSGMHSDLEGWVTPEIWERATRLMAEASYLLHDHNQAPRTEGTIHVSATAWTFKMADPTEPTDPDPTDPGPTDPAGPPLSLRTDTVPTATTEQEPR